jgi:hypothetical protein
MCFGLNVKYPLFLSDFNELEFFLTDLLKIAKYQIFFLNYPVGTELFYSYEGTDGQADVQKLIVTF